MDIRVETYACDKLTKREMVKWCVANDIAFYVDDTPCWGKTNDKHLIKVYIPVDELRFIFTVMYGNYKVKEDTTTLETFNNYAWTAHIN